MENTTTDPTAPLTADQIKEIFNAEYERTLDEIVADKKKRRLKNQKAHKGDIESATNAGNFHVLSAQFKMRVVRQDEVDPLTSDPAWNPKHPLYRRVQELVKTGHRSDVAEDLARREFEAGEIVEGPDEDDLEILVSWLEKQDWSEFALSVAKYYRTNGDLSPKQIASATSMKAKVEARQAEKAATPVAPTSDALDLSTIPSGRYAVPSGDTRLKVSIEHGKKGSRWEGWTFVKDCAEYGQRNRYGTQKPGGRYSGKIENELREILSNPKGAMAAYGKLTSKCGRCNRTLEDAASIAAGIGPVCASGW